MRAATDATAEAVVVPLHGARPEASREDDARRRLRAVLESGSKTQKQVAQAIDYSPSALSTWLRGEYPGDGAELAERVERYLERMAVVAEVRRPSWTQTSIAEGVMRAARYADTRAAIALVVGSPGQGKTTALRQYVKERRTAVMVTCWPGNAGAKALLEDLVEALGLRHRDMGRTLRATMAGVVEALRGTGRLLVVDEAQHLTAQALECLRHIHDETAVGMVLAGNLEVHPLLRREGAGQFAQLFSRIALTHRVPSVCLEADVAALARSAVPELDSGAVDALVAVVRGPGGDLRLLVRVLDLAQSLALQHRLPVTADIIIAASRSLGRQGGVL
jgi:hypothetical protein